MFAVRPQPPMHSTPFDRRPSLDSYESPLHSPATRLERHAFYGSPLSRSMSIGNTSQHALPIQRSNTQVSDGSERTGTYVAEHSLRRKTPNGTLAAGYDATPVDGTLQLPAQKHVLVSSIPDSKPVFPPRSGLGLEAWTRHENASGINSMRHLTKALPQHGFGLGNGLVNTVAQGAMPRNPQTRQNLPLGFDSVLDQTVPLNPSPRFYMQDGSTVPTVLPATLQQFSRPTASAGTGPYGPYWPDGAFVPYRPAPFRDPRFYPSLAFDASRTNSPSAGGSFAARISAGSFLPPYLNQHDQMHSNYPYMQSYHKFSPPSQSGPVYPFQAAFPPQHSHFLNDRSYSNHATPAFGLENARNEPNEAPGSYKSPSTQPSTSEFKERTLAWAHRVYVDLLAILHQNRRNGFHRDGSRRDSKPSIYPKPPRQPGSEFSGLGKQSRSPPAARGKESSLNDSNRSRKGDVNESMRATAAIYSPSNRHQPLPNGSMHFGQHPGSLQSFSDHYSDKYRTMRRPSATGLGHVMFSGADPGSTEMSARAALDMLDHLCSESNWDWIDGMLLGGCLAYGLADYNKAMGLYQKILERDSDNVEAMSNLAATLLAVTRRQEAMEYWLRAVKLRPSYFEAVEHLIGLLNFENRTREAISVIQHVEDSLRIHKPGQTFHASDYASETDSDATSLWSTSTVESTDKIAFDYDESEGDGILDRYGKDNQAPGFGSSGFAIPGADNGRLLALIHAKGNMLYSLGENQAAAAGFEEAILIASGRPRHGIKGIIKSILRAFSRDPQTGCPTEISKHPILLFPQTARLTAEKVFPPHGDLPGFRYVTSSQSQKAAVSISSNSLLSLAKIYQDSMPNVSAPVGTKTGSSVRDILALYYLSLSLQPGPSTANNVGILLANVQQSAPASQKQSTDTSIQGHFSYAGIVAGSGIALALAYYNFGLTMDTKHAHLYTNLGSLLKDVGHLGTAVKMYENAVQCDGNFDIALANLANAVKDQGRVNDAISYYRRAVNANPDFAEAVCGLATALNTICGWKGRGGIYADHGNRDRWHVGEEGQLIDAKDSRAPVGWMKRVVEIVDKQLKDGAMYGRGTLANSNVAETLRRQVTSIDNDPELQEGLKNALQRWSGDRWEGSRIVRLVERANRRITWHWYHDRYTHGKNHPFSRYSRPQLPSNLSTPSAPTLLPFYTFTNPLSPKQIRQISARNGLRISVSTLRSSWIPQTVYPPPSPPSPSLRVGYVSSDFNNHPLAHLMQSVFGMHDTSRVTAYCYATTATDNSIHREQIKREAPMFYDAHSWSTERLVNQIIQDGIHVLVNLNGYTRGARNEVFAARPAPVQMSFMGFAGSLGAEWCDYLLADEHTIPPETLSPWRRNVDLHDKLHPDAHAEDDEQWVYAENVVFTKATFFCCDHKQSAPEADVEKHLTWEEEQEKRWRMRKEIFPTLSNEAVILGNFNQLYKIDPTTLRLYLRILAAVPNAILWLLRFPDIGEKNILHFARQWAGQPVASRIIFTDVAPKGQHISRARIVDLFLDTPECNAHTTSADVVWSGTPVLTWGRRREKMCSRMAGSIVGSALPEGPEGDLARAELIKEKEIEYEMEAVKLAGGLRYQVDGIPRSPTTTPGVEMEKDGTTVSRVSIDRFGCGEGRLMELRKMLWSHRWESRLFDTKRWVKDVERAYWAVWKKWVKGEGGDIYL